MIPGLKKTFSWFGPGDPVSPGAILETGAKEAIIDLLAGAHGIVPVISVEEHRNSFPAPQQKLQPLLRLLPSNHSRYRLVH
ncbi:MAG: hypothetical protein M3O71_21040 [Bacteroidota bacterium]|nr:hypothetical protein [Bacteroidota bacterium]